MGLRFSILAIVITAAQLSYGSVSFPSGCPGDNLKKVCESLSNIPPEQTLVFADGSEMPACFMSAPMKGDAQEMAREKQLTRELMIGINRVFGAEVVKLAMASLYNPEKFRKEFKLPDDLTKKLEELIAYKNKRRPKNEVTAKSTTEEFDFAYKKLSELTAKSPSLNKQVNQQQATALKATKNRPLSPDIKIPCRPMLNAGNNTSNSGKNSVYVYPGLTHFPKPTMLRVIGHEIGHSFDPCKLGDQSANPFKKLISCLQNEVGEFKNSEMYCNDHTAEAFCDYMGAYVVEEWIKENPPKKKIPFRDQKADRVYMPEGYEYIFFDLNNYCMEASDPIYKYDEDKTHPHTSRRLNSIFLKNATIAKAVGCKVDEKTYRCDIINGTVGEKPKSPTLFESLKTKLKSFQ